MKHLLGFDDELYKGLYVTPLVLDETNRRSLNWHNHNIQEAISELYQPINEKYKKDLKSCSIWRRFS